MRALSLLIVTCLLSLAPSSGFAQSRGMSPAQEQQVLNFAERLIKDASKALIRGDEATAVRNFREARRQLETLPPERKTSGRPVESFWAVYTNLGAVADAYQMYEHLSPDSRSRYEEEWLNLKAAYGTISLTADPEVLSDPTLKVELTRIEPAAGTSAALSFGLARTEAQRTLHKALSEKQLYTNPVYIPTGSYTLHVALTRDSGLNYKHPKLAIPFDVPADGSVTVHIDPERETPKPALFAIVVAVLSVPFLLTR